MGLREELGLPNPIRNHPHEAALSVVLTSDLLNKEADRLLRRFGLTEAQFNVLMLLGHQAGPEGLSQTEISRFLLVNRANVTGLVDRMEQSGLIARTTTPGDRRLKRIRMTRKGKEALSKAEAAYFGRIQETFGEMGEVERRGLIRALERIRRLLRRSAD
ncbi:MAG: MarR family transcriptional regulator [Candidatus Omnitrophica bacterium]|nr:Transcriptional activatory protein BadR [bacterium]NUN98097.1 MarR family transcriptional regulator [Candidatus Omnitrophota bacterium]